MIKRITAMLAMAGAMTAFAASQLTFNSSAVPTALTLDDADVLGSNSTAGFYLTYNGGTATKLNTLTQSGDTIRVTNSSGSPEFTFLLQSYDHHVAMHLIDTEGLGASPQDYSLQLRLFSPSNLQINPYSINNLMTTSSSRAYVYLNWPYLWGRARADGSRGSVVLWNKTLTGPALDATLAEVWSVQAAQGHMVKPKVSSWTENDVMEWIDWYVDSFSELSVMTVHPESDADDLYEMLNEYVIPAKPKRVFMFQTSWGTSGQYTVPRASVFPNGESDLRAYSDYLASNGIMLHLKNMTPQVLPSTGDYLTTTSVDDRLMSWSTGTLNGAITSSATTMTFQGEVNVGYEDWESNWKWETEYFRIGNEIVRATGLTNRSNGVWQLTGVSRGQKGTTASAHSSGDLMLGLVSKWNNLNYQEDFDLPNSLGEKIIGDYGSFMNRMVSRHIHFDGTGLNNPPWYMREYTDYAYSQFSYPTTGSTVGGGGLPAHFEKQFSEVQKMIGMLNYFPVRIGVRLHQTGRGHVETATSKLEMNFDIMDGITLGSRRVKLAAGESASKLTKTMLRTYGLSDYAFQLFAYWKELAPVLTDADAEYMGSFFDGKYLNHYKGPDVLTLSKNAQGKYILTPNRTMARTTGEDTLFVVHQEWSGIACWQNITPGTTMELYNPYSEQPLRMMIRNGDYSQDYVNPIITVNSSGTLSITGTLSENEYLEYVGGDTAIVYDSNWVHIRTLPAVANNFTANNGNLTVNVSAGSGRSTTNLYTLFTTLGTPYVMTTNDVLADSNVVDPNRVKVTGMSITPASYSVTLGEQMVLKKLIPTFTPANADDKRIIWSSSDAGVATVADNGVVTPVGEGFAYIIATTADGGFKDSSLVTVLEAPVNLALSGTATQSSGYSTTKGLADLGIDGDTDGRFNSGSVTHTATEDYPWWQVDLGQNFRLGEIEIFGRTDDCCADRMSDYTVYVINAAGDTTFSQAYTTYPYLSIDLDSIEGRIVRIQSNQTDNVMSVAEVRVFNMQEIPVAPEPPVTMVESPQVPVLSGGVNVSQISNDNLMIQVSDSKADRYVIYNAMGKSIVSGLTQGRTTMLDLSGMRPGVYLVKVNGAVQKILKR